MQINRLRAYNIEMRMPMHTMCHTYTSRSSCYVRDDVTGLPYRVML